MGFSVPPGYRRTAEIKRPKLDGYPRRHRRAAVALADLRGIQPPLRQSRHAAGRRKKRLCALADWHFGGGDSYCAACQTQCPDCLGRLNQPTSHDGWQVWDLVGRLGGQMRVAGKAVIGWDMSAALALAQALGLNPMVVAELRPELEAVMVRRINEKIADSD